MRKKRFPWIFIVALAPASLLAATQGEDHAHPSVKSVVHLDHAPVNKEPLHIHLPRPVETKLDNGLTILVVEQHRLPTVQVALWIESGDLSDPRDLPGLAQFTAEMLREGTARRTSAQIASETDALGASLSASSEFGSDVSEISASGLALDLGKLLELASDVALHPSFPEEELAKYKIRKFSSLEEQRASPAFLAQEKLFQSLYPGSPAAVISPTKDSVQKATSKELKGFHDGHYLPNNAMLGIAGDVKAKDAIALAKKYFGDWTSRSPAPTGPEIVPSHQPFKIYLVDRPGSVQTNIVTGAIAVAFKDPDHIPLVIANHILGEGTESRLYFDLREDKGYAYGVSSDVDMKRYPGPWEAEMAVRTEVTGEALAGLLAEFRKLRNEPVSVSELEGSRRAVVSRFALSLESPALLLRRWMLTRYYEVPDDYWDRYPEEAAKVGPSVIQRVARRYLDLDHLQVVCVGDAKQILEPLKKIGPVGVLDADGKNLP